MSLRSLSDQQILSRIHRLTRRERSVTLAVLLHLHEIERRRLHLQLGYSSMFDYCTSGLGYSASAASRRIRTARCVARFPEVYDLLKTNEVNVSTVAQVSRVITPENKDEILARIRGKSQREVEAVAAEFEPLGARPQERVRTVVVRVPAASVPKDGAAVLLRSDANALSGDRADSESDLPAMKKHDRNGCVPDTPAVEPACPGEPNGAASTLERRALLQFSASEAFMAKLERARSLVWHRLAAHASLESVFELALDRLIEREDPCVRKVRRERKAMGRKQVTPNAPKPPRVSRTTTVTVARRIPTAVRDEVYARDHGNCTFTGADGRRCASKRALQIDHIKPVAVGGIGETANLRLLCAYHNRLEAERLLGALGRPRAGPPRP